MKNSHKSYLQTYRKIRSNVYCVHLYWEIYKQIYAGNSTRFSIINASSRKYFAYSEDVYLSYVESGLMRLLDPAISTFRKPNMSIEKLIEEIDMAENNPKLISRLKRTHIKLKEKAEKLKKRRNKARSHNDYDVACGHIKVPPISRKDVNDVIDVLDKLMAIIESYMEITGLDECASIEARTSAHELFSCLSDGLKYRKLLKTSNKKTQHLKHNKF